MTLIKEGKESFEYFKDQKNDVSYARNNKGQWFMRMGMSSIGSNSEVKTLLGDMAAKRLEEVYKEMK